MVAKKMSLLESFLWSAIALLATSSLTREQEVTFIVKPDNQTVAAHTEARFYCVVTDNGTAHHLDWDINGHRLEMNEKNPANSRYSAKWHTALNSTLHYNASLSDNGAKVTCIVTTLLSHHRKEAYLLIAEPPSKPADFVAKYNRTHHRISLQWQHPPSTHNHIFPILKYTATVYCSHTSRRLLQPISIDGHRTSYTMYLNESELCTCGAIYVNLTAKNSIGRSPQAQAFLKIFQDYEPFPINTSLSLQPDGRTLVSVAFPRPACFKQGLQSIMVEEVVSMRDDVPHVSLYDSNDDIVESFVMTAMKPDAMYSVTVHVKSETMNISSLPVMVSLSDADAHSMRGNDNGMVLIIAASIGAFLLCATAVGATTCVIVMISLRRSKKEKYTISMQMQSNPIYEGPLYETISEASAPLSAITLGECHIFKGTSSTNCSVSQLCATEALVCCSDSSNGNTHMNEYMTHTRGGEDDYMVMHPVTESPVQLQTDV